MRVVRKGKGDYQPSNTFMPGSIIQTSSGAIYLVVSFPDSSSGAYVPSYVLIDSADGRTLSAPRVYHAPVAGTARLYEGELILSND